MEKKRRRLPPEFAAPLTPCNAPVRRCPVPREQASHRVLIMRVGAFGDILMGTPLLAALRDAWPDAHLTWVVEHSQVQAIDANPYIDELIVWDGSYWKGMVRRALYPLWLARALQFRRALRERSYDVFISFQPEEWPLLTRAVGAPVSVGVFDTFRQYNGDRPTSRHTGLYTHAYTVSDLPPHRTDQYLLPLRALGLPQRTDRQMTLGYTAEDDGAVDSFLSGAGFSPRDSLAVLAPLTSWPSRCWPGERYAQVAAELSRQGRRVVWIGSPKEREAVQRLTVGLPSAVAAGPLSFREAAALIARASVVVSGDTGPMHVAAAVGAPYVALFGPTPVPVLAPRTGIGLALAHPVPCGPCYQPRCGQTGDGFLRCQRAISVAEVLEATARVARQTDVAGVT